MKRYLLLLVCTLAGCGEDYVDKARWDTAVELCASHGGIGTLYGSNIDRVKEERIRVICADTSRIEKAYKP